MIGFFLIFIVWHLFYLVLKNIINFLIIFEIRFSKGLLLSILGALIVIVFLIKPILVVLEKTIRLVFFIVDHSTNGFSEDARAMMMFFAIVLNFSVFVALHIAAKKSRNIYFRWFYELGFPGRDFRNHR